MIFFKGIKAFVFLGVVVTTISVAAQDTIYIKHNDDIKGYLIPGNEEHKAYINSIDKENSQVFILELNRGMYANQAYIKSIEITNTGETERFEFPLNHSTLLTENISEALQKLKFFREKEIKVFLLLNPPAEQMLFPARRIPAGIIMIKNS